MFPEPLRVMVVDDAGLYRKILSDMLSQIDGVEVVGTASNGRMALSKGQALKPHLLTLDVEMPVMDGLETLRHLHASHPQIGVIMVSAHTAYGADITVRALEQGAFDFITKPEEKTAAENAAHLQRQLKPLLRAFQTKRYLKGLVSRGGAQAEASRETIPAEQTHGEGNIVQRMQALCRHAPPQLLAMGLSTGGPQALAHLIPQLPLGLGVPGVVGIHMPSAFTASLAESLNRKSSLTVVEACTGQVLEKDTVYIAPGGRQMKVIQPHGQQRPSLVITDDPPENYCKPSIDYLFRSGAEVYGNRALGIMMTGMGNDGVSGLKLMKARGAMAMAQDEASSVVFGMPREAIKSGIVDLVVPLDQMGQAICQRLLSPPKQVI